MKIRKIKKTVLSIALAASISMPSMVSATYPTIDFSNLLEAITQNYQDMQNWAQERMMMMAEMDLQSALSSLGIDAENNAITNLLVREGKRAQTIQNIEVMEWSMIDSDACSTLASQIVTEETEKRADKKKAVNAKESITHHMGFGDSLTKWKEEQTARQKAILETCESLLPEGLEPSDPDVKLNYSFCVDGGNVVDAGVDGILNKKESLAAEEAIKILVGVTSKFKRSSALTNGDDKTALMLKESRVEIFRDMARNSLEEVNSQFRSDGTLPSAFASLKKFDDDRYGNEKWLKDVQNVNPDNKNGIYISEINRKIAVMNSFLVHMEIIKYRQALRVEGLHAAMLALKVEPL